MVSENITDENDGFVFASTLRFSNICLQSDDFSDSTSGSAFVQMAGNATFGDTLDRHSFVDFGPWRWCCGFVLGLRFDDIYVMLTLMNCAGRDVRLTWNTEMNLPIGGCIEPGDLVWAFRTTANLNSDIGKEIRRRIEAVVGISRNEIRSSVIRLRGEKDVISQISKPVGTSSVHFVLTSIIVH